MLGLMLAICCLAILAYLVSWGLGAVAPSIPAPLRGILVFLVVVVLLFLLWHFSPTDWDGPIWHPHR